MRSPVLLPISRQCVDVCARRAENAGSSRLIGSPSVAGKLSAMAPTNKIQHCSTQNTTSKSNKAAEFIFSF
jgi:hypothetical protein